MKNLRPPPREATVCDSSTVSFHRTSVLKVQGCRTKWSTRHRRVCVLLWLRENFQKLITEKPSSSHCYYRGERGQACWLPGLPAESEPLIHLQPQPRFNCAENVICAPALLSRQSGVHSRGCSSRMNSLAIQQPTSTVCACVCVCVMSVV